MYFETSKTWPEAPRMSHGAACIQGLGVGMLVLLMVYPAPLEAMAARVALSVCA